MNTRLNVFNDTTIGSLAGAGTVFNVPPVGPFTARTFNVGFDGTGWLTLVGKRPAPSPNRIETLSDNRNRTVGDLRYVLSKNGGNLGASGCVAFLFEKRGVISFERAGIDGDALLEAALEAGAQDVVESDDRCEVMTAPTELHAVRDGLAERGFTALSAEFSQQPSTTVKLSGKDAEQMLKLAESLEDLDDVQNFYANFDISEEELEKLA